MIQPKASVSGAEVEKPFSRPRAGLRAPLPHLCSLSLSLGQGTDLVTGLMEGQLPSTICADCLSGHHFTVPGAVGSQPHADTALACPPPQLPRSALLSHLDH